MEAFDKWLLEALNGLSIDGEVYTEYIKTIVEDEGEDLETREENVNAALEAASGDPHPQTTKQILNEWTKAVKALEEQTIKEQEKQQHEVQSALAMAHKKLKEEQANKGEEDAKPKPEVIDKEKLLMAYDCETETNGLEGTANSNRQQAKAYLEAQKQKNKAEHIKHKKEIAKMQANEKQRKAEKEEKKKNRAPKKERQR